MAVLSWRASDVGKWTATKPSANDAKATARVMTILAEFLETGLRNPTSASSIDEYVYFPVWHIQSHAVPDKSSAYGYLNLFGQPPDEKNRMLEDREDRSRIYYTTFASTIEAGLDSSKVEGGELGRAAGTLDKVLSQSGRDMVDE